MANLSDNIRLTTVADLQALSELVNEYKKLGLSISGVAGASRIVSEQIKRDALEQANATKQATLQTQLSTAELNRQSAELRKNNLELKAQAAALGESKKSSDGLLSSLSSLSGLRSQLIGLFGVMSVGAFAKDMVDAQSKVEAFGLSMKNLLGADYGGKLVADLKRFTVSTPLNFEEVIKTTNQLVGSFKAAGASSKTIGTEIPQILESLGNSAAALGGDGRLGRLVYAFSQVQATGRLMGTEVRQITETGFPLLAVMSQTTGKSVQELQKDITAGKVSFEIFKEAILSAGKEGGVFAGSMDIMANTVRGRIDKLKETTFFALANIGNQFNTIGKSAINFASNIVESLFGTESAAKRSVEVIKTAITTWAAYAVATRLASASLASNTLIGRAALLLKGQLILANASLTGSYNVLTAAETQATTAARTFNTTLATNPFGLLILSIGAVVTAYEIYNGSVKEAQEKQRKLFDDIATAVAPIKTQKEEFNNLAKAVLSTTLPLSEQEKILQRLKLQYPLLLKGVTDLSTAEDILNKNKHKTNSTLDFRNEKLDALKKKYPEQLKGIDTLAEAESKLAGVVRLTNRDFAILTATMENNVRMQAQLDGATDNFKKKLESEREIARIRAGGALGITNAFKTEDQVIAAEQAKIAAYDKTAKSFAKAAEVIRAENARLAEEITFQEEKKNEKINNLGKDAKEKALKYQKDTNEQIKIASEKIFAENLEDSRQKDLILRNLEYRNQQERIKNAIGSQKLKNKLLLDLEQAYDADISKLHQTWDEKELKATEEKNKSLATLDKNRYELSEKLRILNLILAAKSSDEIQRIEEDAADNILKENKKTAEKQVAIEVAKLKSIADKGKEGTLEYIEQDKIVLDSKNKLAEAEIKLTDLTLKYKRKATKEEEDLINKLQKLDENNAKESVELEGDKQELIGKLRKLELMSRAKNSKDAIDIQNRENEKILRGNVELSETRLSQEKALLVSMAMLGQKNTEEYKKQQGVILKAEQLLTKDQIKLAEFVTDKKKDELEKQYDFTAQSIVDLIKIYKRLNDGVDKSSEELQTLLKNREKAAVGATLFLANFAMDAISNIVDRNISKTTDGIRKIELEHNKAVLGIAQQASSAAMSFLSGDIAGGITKGLGALVNGIGLIGTKSAAVSKYWTEKSIEELEDYGQRVESEVDRIVARIDDIKEAYGEIKLESGATIGGTLSEDLGLDAALKSLWEVGKAIKAIPTELDKLNAIQWNFDIGTTGLDFKTLDDWRVAIGITGRSVDELIQAEITRGQQIQKTYEDAVGKENELFEQRKDSADKIYKDAIDNINDLYDKEVDKINKKYDYESIRANQQYNAETLGIVAAGTAQLEALITNEESLASVRKEFADKRIEIEEAFPLAAKQITSDMSQAEITAINDSIKARDEAFAKLQGWYNTELTAIINSEGQKRKEYTATELIQNQIQRGLETAALKFQGQEIQRAKDKAQAIIDAETARDAAQLVALGVKNEAISKATEILNTNLVALEKKKNEDIATSFKILTELLKVYSEDITKAMEDTAVKGSDAYRKLAQELNVVNELLKQIRGNSNSAPLNIGIGGGLNITPFAKGTDNLSSSMSGTPKAGKTGGWLIEGHEGEAIFSKPNMDEMTRFMGSRPTREDVIERFKMGTKLIDSNSFIQKISPYVISKTEGNVNIDLQGLRSDLSKLTREVVKRQQPIVNIDKNGIRTYLTNINSQIEIKNQKFSS